MANGEAIQLAARELNIILRADEDGRMILANKINELIERDFQKLVNILYRIDVDESKLKTMLQDHSNADAGLIIVDLIIERQEQKIKSREQFNQQTDKTDDNEKW